MASTYRATRRVEFHQTDAAGIMHFSAIFTLMEAAEHELLRSLGLSVVSRDNGQTISWPRVSAQCDFLGAAKFEDALDIDVAVARLGSKSVTYSFHVWRGKEEIAAGNMTSVCCVIEADKPPRSVEIPARFIQQLEPYVGE